MSAFVYVAVGWLLMTLSTAAFSRVGFAHVTPDGVVVALVFVALRREPAAVTLCALVLGYIAGAQALAPVGLHEAAMVACGLAVYLTGGNLAAGGSRFFVLASGGAVMFYHFALYVLSRLIGGTAGFSGWATAVLVPSALATTALAYVCHPLLNAIERRLTPEEREELSWS